MRFSFNITKLKLFLNKHVQCVNARAGRIFVFLKGGVEKIL
jgi:hypothetical protein